MVSQKPWLCHGREITISPASISTLSFFQCSRESISRARKTYHVINISVKQHKEKQGAERLRKEEVRTCKDPSAVVN